MAQVGPQGERWGREPGKESEVGMTTAQVPLPRHQMEHMTRMAEEAAGADYDLHEVLGDCKVEEREIPKLMRAWTRVKQALFIAAHLGAPIEPR